MKRFLIPIFLPLLLPVLAASPAPIVPTTVIPLFNGRDLSKFDTPIVDTKLTDPDRVFTVVEQIDGAPAIRISGQHFGALVTRERYANYRLVAEFRWGLLTWGERKNRARGAGIMLHCQGEFGNKDTEFNRPWGRSIEFVIIQGGTGSLYLVPGYDRTDGRLLRPELTVTTNGTSRVWQPGGTPRVFDRLRIDHLGRDPNWENVIDFRGRDDVERPYGEWNRVEITCDGDRVIFVVNGRTVNEGTKSSLQEGTLLFQSEGAEIFFRRIELHPLPRRPLT